MKRLITLFFYFLSAGSAFASDPILEVQINSRHVQKAMEEELLFPIFDESLVSKESVSFEGDEQPPFVKVLSCLTYLTPPQISLFKVSTIQEGNKRDFIFEHATGQPAMSNILVETDEGDLRLHHDVVVKHLLEDNTFLSGLRVSTLHSGWSVTMQAGDALIFDRSVISSRGPVNLKSPKVDLETGGWFRTPTGVRLSPLEGVLSCINKIEIEPRLFHYDQGELDQSWTTYIKGKIDFVNSIINLEVHNATVSISFNKDILPRKNNDEID